MREHITTLGLILLLILLLCMPCALVCIHWVSGDKTYTGYIYSVTEDIGLTEAHLRFSEYAGPDSQPSFCIAENDKEKVQALAGSGKKVKVFIPAGFAMDLPWKCPIPAQIEVMEEE